MDSILIREIQKGDNVQIANVIREVFISDDYPKTGTAFADSQLDFMFEAYDKPRSTYFVVEINGKIIGGAGVSQLENSNDTICELQKMYFLNEARGKGLASIIYDYIIAKTKLYSDVMQTPEAKKLWLKLSNKYNVQGYNKTSKKTFKVIPQDNELKSSNPSFTLYSDQENDNFLVASK